MTRHPETNAVEKPELNQGDLLKTETIKNQLASCTGCYDENVNRFSDQLHTYNAENRLSTVDGQSSYSYVPESNCVATKVNGAITSEYLYDLNNQLVTILTAQDALIRNTLDAGANTGAPTRAASWSNRVPPRQLSRCRE